MILFVIDDDIFYRFILNKYAQGNILIDEIYAFPDGKSAIDFFSDANNFKSKIPDIIFLDLNMPILNGWQFLDWFSKNRDKFKKDITIYILSSSVNPIEIKEVSKFPFVAGYLTKPLNIEAFNKLIQEKTCLSN